MPEERTAIAHRVPPYQRWYQFGWRSPSVLLARMRNRHRWLFRLRMAWQRARHGYSDEQCWGLDYAVATLVVAGIQKMRKWRNGYPLELGSWEEWERILIVIEQGFQTFLDCDGVFLNDEEEARFKAGMESFARWFGALWD